MGNRNGYWPTHPDKDLQRVLIEYHENEWKITKGTGYYKLYCPCGQHKTTMHLTPSDPNYGKNKLALLKRTACQKKAHPKEPR